MPKILVYQTAPVWFVKNEYFMAKIDVCRSLLPSDRVIGWDIEMTSDTNSNAFKCKFYKHVGSPNLATIAKFDEIVKIGGCTQLVVPKTEFQDGSDQTRIFTHKIIILA